VTETSVPTYTAAFGGACNASGQVILAIGANLTCTITNTLVPPVITQTLIVNKVVVGGPLNADDFPLFVDGAQVSRGVATEFGVGAHTVTETALVTYSATFGDACATSGQVSLASGAHVTCTITNTYTPAAIAVTKTVGTDPQICAATTVITVALQTDVAFCITIRNTGQVTLTQHHIVDPLLQIEQTLAQNLEPGGTFTLLPADLPALVVTAGEEITNTVTVTSASAPASDGAVEVSASASAQVHIEPPTPSGTVYMPALFHN
jgi:hypothetical protein